MTTNDTSLAVAPTPPAEAAAPSPARASLRRDTFSTLHLACFAPAQKTPVTTD
jgi:hypothetical protein